MKIDTQLNDLETAGQRTMKYVKYFGKTLMTDRFMMCMILMIVLAIISLIIVAVLKNKA